MSARGRVLVAMSGGVDSSVAAALLRQAGYDVIGCFMRLGPAEDSSDGFHPAGPPDRRPAPGVCARPAPGVHRGCCSLADAADARLVAAELGIPLYVCNFRRDFARVMAYFADEYAAGRTPNPCVRCNDWLKFGRLFQYARQLGARFVASGHYARIGPVECNGQNTPALWRGADRAKDQSYVLFGVNREHLSRMLLPVGQYDKAHVRELARRFGLPVFDKPDSQEICFVPGGDYATVVERLRPDVAGTGAIVDESGRRLGTHRGQHRFTVGQRRGLALPLAEPHYVIRREAASNTVVVGPRDRLATSACVAGEANWLCEPPPPGTWWPVLAQSRYNSPAARACVRVLNPCDGPTPSGRRGRFALRFDSPQFAVAPGQALVLYDVRHPDLLLGGGWIEETA